MVGMLDVRVGGADRLPTTTRLPTTLSQISPKFSQLIQGAARDRIRFKKLEMSVVGFDIGNENCVIAVPKKAQIVVLLNDESKCETPAIVSFGEKQRFLGSAGAASATMNPKSTISQVKRLIGSQYKDKNVQKYLRLLPFETSKSPNGGILIHLQYLNERRTFTPVQILGMLLAHLKQMVEKNLESRVVDCVIGIPSYFTDFQRREYLNAAFIAGLNPLKLMHDCTATALGYGMYKTESELINVVFVDIGHCDTQVTVAAFESREMKILSHSFDPYLGGRDFDDVLFKHFAAQFKEEYNIDVYSNIRASIRLRASCEKLKKVLSANAEAPLSIECLMDEKDVTGFITRQEFENLSSELLERVTIPCRKALKECGLSYDQIYSIELVGSGSRIPAIMRKLTSFFRNEPRRTLNASECVARGCALQCAMLSPTYRVREYEIQDSLPFSVEVLVNSDDNNKDTWPKFIFPKGSPFPSKKILTYHRGSTFHLEVICESDVSAEFASIGLFRIGPFHTSGAGEANVKVKECININGIFQIEYASLIEEDANSVSDNAHLQPEKMVRTSPDSSLSTTYNADERRKRRMRQNVEVSENISETTNKDELLHAQETERRLAWQDIVEQTKERSYQQQLKIPLKEIQLATNGFHADYLIGRGGFGGVYKAELFHLDVRKYVKMNDFHRQSIVENSTYPRRKGKVAVKKLDSRYGQGKKQFLQEIEVLSVLNHQNIVPLLGFCDEDDEMILVYEYASNGSLDRHIGKIGDVYGHTWAQRLQICLDVAHGLKYLHEMDIIHRDIKSANILIGDNKEGMIGDFGLSRVKKNTNVEFSVTDVAGTAAYVEPKYARTGMLTKQTDIYSLGVVLLEVFCGRLAVSPTLGDDPEYLLHQAKRHFQQKTFNQMIDPYLNEEFEKSCAISGNTSFSDSINAFAEITYKCLHNDQAHHLTMKDVVKELKKASTIFHGEGVEMLSTEPTKLDTNNFTED